MEHTSALNNWIKCAYVSSDLNCEVSVVILRTREWMCKYTVYPKKYAHGFVVICFVVVMQLFIMNSHEEFIYIHQGCFVGTGAIVRLPQCQWSKPNGYGKISQCITTTKQSKAKTVCIFVGIYCTWVLWQAWYNTKGSHYFPCTTMYAYYRHNQLQNNPPFSPIYCPLRTPVVSFIWSNMLGKCCYRINAAYHSHRRTL